MFENSQKNKITVSYKRRKSSHFGTKAQLNQDYQTQRVV